ncbi:MAG TPA: heme exporter protein CcmD [Vicinamibacterales bacterium]|jgi:hypothetical protein|nr:heme exporter protein CcmD [Vicinamibacterales bacterium]
MHSALPYVWTAVAIVGAVIALLVWWVLSRGRLVAGEHVFRASRWSKGNHLFPTQVAVTPTSVVQYTPQWLGRREHSIHMAHISSVEVDTNLFFSNVVIETSGGSDPVTCHGHLKHDAIEMKRLINEFQGAYYGKSQPPSA